MIGCKFVLRGHSAKQVWIAQGRQFCIKVRKHEMLFHPHLIKSFVQSPDYAGENAVTRLLRHVIKEGSNRFRVLVFLGKCL